MTFVAFGALVIVVCVVAWIVTLILKKIPDTPAWASQIVWLVALLIVIATLLEAMGILGGTNPTIPRLR